MKSIYDKAKEKVERKKVFYVQLVCYMIILLVGGIIFAAPAAPLLVIIKFWFYWVMFVCGISMTLHYFKIFGLPEIVEDFLSIFSNWEEKAINKEIDRLQQDEKQKDTKSEPEEQLSLKELQKIQSRSLEDSDLV